MTPAIHPSALDLALGALAAGQHRDPFALRTLVVAYQKLGKHAESNQAAETLLQLNRPTLEQALIVPAFRLQRQGERRAHFGNAEPRTADTPASR